MLRDNKPAPLTIPNYQETAEWLLNYQNNKCPCCGEYLKSTNGIHHGLIKNNASIRKEFPVLVHHVVNLFIPGADCHESFPSFMQIQNVKILRRIENMIIKNTNLSDSELKDRILEKYKYRINWRKEPK